MLRQKYPLTDGYTVHVDDEGDASTHGGSLEAYQDHCWSIFREHWGAVHHHIA